jgi:glycerol-3-phosphate acyltransferase PlsY
VWLRFKGGKGVATMMGISLALAWPIGLAYALVWLGVLFASRISSLGGMCAALAAPLAAFAAGYGQYAPVLAVLAVMILWLHRANIARLRAGTEPGSVRGAAAPSERARRARSCAARRYPVRPCA